MSDLLDQAIEAHGGMTLWRQIKRITTRKTIEGMLWKIKEQDHNIRDSIFRVDPHRPHSSYALTALPNINLVYDGDDRASIQTDDGEVLEYRPAPRAALAALPEDHPWDLLHLAYFAGYAGWNYLTAPFIFTWPGFEIEEIDPWDEGEETWRRLKVQFSPDVPTHSREQIFYFDSAGLIRRQDYSTILSKATFAHYLHDHQTFSGLTIPTLRKAYYRLPDGTPQPQPVTVHLRYADMTLE